MYASRFSKRKAKARRPYKRVARKVSRPSKALTQAIKKVIHQQTENKEAYRSLALTAFNSGIDNTGDSILVVPDISTGTQDNARIGDQLRGQKLSIRGHIISASQIPQSSANSRIAVRLMVVQPRYLSNRVTVLSQSVVWQSSLLKKGGSTTGFTGEISDLYAPINSDAIITYYDKVMYLPIPQVYVGNSGGTQLVVTSVDMSKSVKFFNINLKVKNKLLKYDATISTTQPLNYSPTFILGYVHLDGSTADVVNTQVSCAFDSVFQYEDA